jgi:hypothetical protein
MSKAEKVAQAIEKEESHCKKEYDSFADEVWDTLSRIDVSDHIDVIEATAKRPEISYVAWHTAWALLKRKFPASVYHHFDDIRHPDETVEVEIEVLIRRTNAHEVDSIQRTNARLSVMDQWMNAIPNPTARQVNDSRQRVLVKALAFAGLGLNLWGDEVLPVGVMEDAIGDDELALITDLIKKSDTNEESFCKWADGIESVAEMTNERYPKAKALLQAKIIRKQKEKKS